jgi:hypothetical protein
MLATARLQSMFRLVRSGTRYRGAAGVRSGLPKGARIVRRSSRPLTVCGSFAGVPRLPESGNSTPPSGATSGSKGVSPMNPAGQDALATARPTPGTAVRSWRTGQSIEGPRQVRSDSAQECNESRPGSKIGNDQAISRKFRPVGAERRHRRHDVVQCGQSSLLDTTAAD